MEKKIHDSELGIVKLRTHPRATRYTIKVAGGEVIGTMPPTGDEQILLRLISENKPRLLQHIQKRTRPILDESTQLKTFSFTLRILRHNQTRFIMALKENFLNIACPANTDFADSNTQQTLRNMLQMALRHEAKRLLPVRLKALAEQYGFSYKSVKIQSSKSRWGSCSSSRNINLSLNLMLLPAHLIDYVLLHELCHTVEMNHGERFWLQMSRVTNNQAKLLRKELKSFNHLTAFAT